MHKFTKIVSKLILIILLILPAVILQILISQNSNIVLGLVNFVRNYLVIYIVILLAIKVVGIVYPPLPGVAFTLTSIALIGWELAYAIDLVGSMLGASLAYFLGAKYGYRLLIKLFGKTLANKIANIKLKSQNQVEAGVVLRFAGGGILSDGLVWGAKLIGFRYKSFLIGYIISHLITTLPVFYLVSASITLNSWVVVVGVAILAWLVIYKFKGRYFE